MILDPVRTQLNPTWFWATWQKLVDVEVRTQLNHWQALMKIYHTATRKKSNKKNKCEPKQTGSWRRSRPWWSSRRWEETPRPCSLLTNIHQGTKRGGIQERNEEQRRQMMGLKEGQWRRWGTHMFGALTAVHLQQAERRRRRSAEQPSIIFWRN